MSKYFSSRLVPSEGTPLFAKGFFFSFFHSFIHFLRIFLCVLVRTCRWYTYASCIRVSWTVLGSPFYLIIHSGLKANKTRFHCANCECMYPVASDMASRRCRSLLSPSSWVKMATGVLRHTSFTPICRHTLTHV